MATDSEKFFEELMQRDSKSVPIEIFEKIFFNNGSFVHAGFEDRNWTPIIFAARYNRLDVVKLLVEKYRVNVNALTDDRCTALMYAMKASNLEVAEYLLKNGADANIQNYLGETALFYARDKKAAKLLIDNGADIHLKNKFGRMAYEKYDIMAPANEKRKRTALNRFIVEYNLKLKGEEQQKDL